MAAVLQRLNYQYLLWTFLTVKVFKGSNWVHRTRETLVTSAKGSATSCHELNCFQWRQGGTSANNISIRWDIKRLIPWEPTEMCKTAVILVIVYHKLD
jgi:hypothetical protein